MAVRSSIAPCSSKHVLFIACQLSQPLLGMSTRWLCSTSSSVNTSPSLYTGTRTALCRSPMCSESPSPRTSCMAHASALNYAHCSSFHYHVLGGVLLAYAVYSPTYSSMSPYIRGTIREDPKFLLGCAAIWLVRPLISIPQTQNANRDANLPQPLTPISGPNCPTLKRT